HGFDRGEQRCGHHHHAGTAAEGLVVDAAVRVGGRVTRVVQAHVEQSVLAGAADHRQPERRLQVRRKDREDADEKNKRSNKPGGGSITTTPGCRSTTKTTGPGAPPSSTSKS